MTPLDLIQELLQLPEDEFATKLEDVKINKDNIKNVSLTDETTENLITTIHREFQQKRIQNLETLFFVTSILAKDHYNLERLIEKNLLETLHLILQKIESNELDYLSHYFDLLTVICSSEKHKAAATTLFLFDFLPMFSKGDVYFQINVLRLICDFLDTKESHHVLIDVDDIDSFLISLFKSIEEVEEYLLQAYLLELEIKICKTLKKLPSEMKHLLSSTQYMKTININLNGINADNKDDEIRRILDKVNNPRDGLNKVKTFKANLFLNKQKLKITEEFKDYISFGRYLCSFFVPSAEKKTDFYFALSEVTSVTLAETNQYSLQIRGKDAPEGFAKQGNELTLDIQFKSAVVSNRFQSQVIPTLKNATFENNKQKKLPKRSPKDPSPTSEHLKPSLHFPSWTDFTSPTTLRSSVQNDSSPFSTGKDPIPSLEKKRFWTTDEPLFESKRIKSSTTEETPRDLSDALRSLSAVLDSSRGGPSSSLKILSPEDPIRSELGDFEKKIKARRHELHREREELSHYFSRAFTELESRLKEKTPKKLDIESLRIHSIEALENKMANFQNEIENAIPRLEEKSKHDIDVVRKKFKTEIQSLSQFMEKQNKINDLLSTMTRFPLDL